MANSVAVGANGIHGKCDADDRKKSNILDLPAEIIELIADHLEQRRLRRLRLVSTKFVQDVHKLFLDARFRSLTILVSSEKSLDRCLEIAQKPEYARAVRKVVIYLDEYPDNRGRKQRRTQQLQMKRSRLDTIRLISSFQYLGKHSANASIHIRSGSDLGRRKAGDSLGSKFNSRGLSQPDLIDMRPFQLIMAALSASKLCIKTLTMDAFGIDNLYSVPVHLAALAPAITQIQSVFQNLTELQLDLWIATIASTRALTFFKSIANAPNLQRLAIRGRDFTHDELEFDPGEAADYAIGKALCAVQFCRLRCLRACGLM